MLKEDIANQMLITGCRGVGKTFLLKKILNDQDECFLTSYIDVSNIYARKICEITEEALMKEILFSIRDSITKDEKLYKKAIENIKIILKQHKIKNFDFNNSSDIFDIPIPVIKDNYEELSRFVMELPQKIVDSKENLKGFIIVIDEFQLLKSLKSPEAFFWLIISYAQKQYNVSYIFTGSVSRTSEILAMLNGQTGAFG